MSETVKQEGEFSLKGKAALTEEKKEVKETKEPIKVTLQKPDAEKQPEEITKVIIKKEPDADTEQETADVADDQRAEPVQEMDTEVSSGESPVQNEVEEKNEVIDILQEVTETKEKTVIKATEEKTQEPKANLPENVEKLVEFMKETGGTVEDYVRLNADYSNVDNDVLLKEYYKQTKPHLDTEEINFLLEDQFQFDEDIDEDRDIRKKKLAKKEEIAKAKTFLEGLKSKYYAEIKLKPGLTQEQSEASEFFNRYTENQKVVEQQHEKFVADTKKLFSQDFKGFEINVGEKTFRYGIQNASKVAENQTNINNLIGKFLNDTGEVVDTKGYHKAIYAAENVDTIAKHFYEQGKADAIKDVTAKSKNINTEARASAPSDITVGGIRVKAITGVDSSKLRIKKKF